jgi:DNA-binding NarL/FixJ family response regulator
MTINKVTVGIVDDSIRSRNILSIYLELHSKPLFELVLELESLNEIDELRELEIPPQFIFLDTDIPYVKGSDGISLLLKRFPESRIIMFTDNEDEHLMFNCLRAGAMGYLCKDTKVSELSRSILNIKNSKGLIGLGTIDPTKGSFEGLYNHSSILNIINGKGCLTSRLNLKLFNYVLLRTNLLDCLNVREKDIFRALIIGGGFEIIAYNLEISVSAIYGYLRDIYNKLMINSRYDCISMLRSPNCSFYLQKIILN